MATVAIGAYRHARRADIGLSEMYAFMDRAIDEQFGPDHFVTAQMMRLNIATGQLQWVNAGHPAPLLIRDRTGWSGSWRARPRCRSASAVRSPQVSEQICSRGDRVLCFTDGLIEEHQAGGEQFGEEQLIEWTNRIVRDRHGGAGSGARALPRPEAGTRRHHQRRRDPLPRSSGAAAPPTTSPSSIEMAHRPCLSSRIRSTSRRYRRKVLMRR